MIPVKSMLSDNKYFPVGINTFFFVAVISLNAEVSSVTPSPTAPNICGVTLSIEFNLSIKSLNISPSIISVKSPFAHISPINVAMFASRLAFIYISASEILASCEAKR